MRGKTLSLRVKRKLLDPVGSAATTRRKTCQESFIIKSDTGQGQNVYTGFVDHLCPGGSNSSMSPVAVALEVIERLSDADGNCLLIPTIEVNTYWKHLAGAASQVYALYHDHGSSEQFHSELKSELDIDQLPSGKLCVNGIVLLCGRLAFNLVRTLGQEVSFEQIWLP